MFTSSTERIPRGLETARIDRLRWRSGLSDCGHIGLRGDCRQVVTRLVPEGAPKRLAIGSRPPPSDPSGKVELNAALNRKANSTTS